MFQEPPEPETLTECQISLTWGQCCLSLFFLHWPCFSGSTKICLMKKPPYSSISYLCHHMQRVQLLSGQVQPAERALWNWAGCALCSVYGTGHWFSLPAISPQCPHTAGHTQSQPNFLPRPEPICRTFCAVLKNTEVIFSGKCSYELNPSQMCPLEL